MDVQPVILEGNLVRLDPMTIEHIPALCAVGQEPFLWKLIPTKVTDEDSMSTYVRSALRDQEKGISLPFVTVERESGTIVGSTRFGNIDVNNRRAEIGWTWIAPNWQRTAVNTEAKLLMMTHAFETWGCVRVELKTDVLNERSRNAILRIGAKQEGIFRKHVICDDGRFRDTVYFSIINIEWPTVKAELLKKLGRN
jgi:RimJ/RimL family protein N-acetyltransferase